MLKEAEVCPFLKYTNTRFVEQMPFKKMLFEKSLMHANSFGTDGAAFH